MFGVLIERKWERKYNNLLAVSEAMKGEISES